jgi:hypothetical protein
MASAWPQCASSAVRRCEPHCRCSPPVPACTSCFQGPGTHTRHTAHGQQQKQKQKLYTHPPTLPPTFPHPPAQDLHKQLEARISSFHGTEDTILYPSCFDANAGLFEALLMSEDAVISDELNHASIIDGIRLCKVGSSGAPAAAGMLCGHHGWL